MKPFPSRLERKILFNGLQQRAPPARSEEDVERNIEDVPSFLRSVQLAAPALTPVTRLERGSQEHRSLLTEREK